MDERKYPRTEEQVQAELRKTRITGYVYALFVLAIGFGISYSLWPAEIADTPLSSVTFGALLRALGSIAIGVVTLVVGIYELVDSASYRG